MAPPRCLCDAIFGTIFSLRNHASLRGHLIECECGTLFGNKELLKDHQQNGYWDLCCSTSFTKLQVDVPHGKIPSRFYCGVCRDTHFRTSKQRDGHLVSMHNACPTCFEVFPSLVDTLEHQASADHCYCYEHELAFPCLEDLAQHACADSHNEGITCQCHTTLYSDGDYERHLNNGHCDYVDMEGDDEKARLEEPTYAEAQLARLEHSNLWCKDCDWRFASVEAYLQHKNSPRHDTKLLELDCSCGRRFSFLSALVAHLESGSCASGMTRDNLNGIVYRYDKDRRITKAEHANLVTTSTIAGSSKASITPNDSASMLDMNVDRLSISGSHTGSVQNQTLTPDYNVDTSGFLTPDGSEFTVADDNDFIATPSASDKSGNSSDTVFVTTPTASAGDLTLTAGSLVGAGTLTSTFTTDSDDGIIVTPPGSSIEGGSDEWAFIKPTPSSASVDGSSVATVKFDTEKKSWPCSKCPRTFAAKPDLYQHMASATHAPKIFNSPTGISDWSGTSTSKRDFKTASGLLQHAEHESAKGEAGDLKTIMEIMEKSMDKKLKATMRSLEW